MNVCLRYGREDPPPAVAATRGAETPGSLTCSIGREDPPEAVAVSGGAAVPGSLRSVVQVSATTARVFAATTAITAAAVTATGVTANVLATVAVTGAVVIIAGVTASVFAAAVVVVTATDTITATEASDDATRAVADFTVCLPGAGISQQRTGGWRITAETDKGRDRGYGVWAAIFEGGAGGYRSYTLPPSSTGQNPPLPTRPASELSTPNSYGEACADEYSEIVGAKQWRRS